ncbi:hypothetical protein Ddc_08393 [Ditylenchus destructor]|nr:hypothetical protein Ddc_08393 [Ditylenchus destructor]
MSHYKLFAYLLFFLHLAIAEKLGGPYSDDGHSDELDNLGPIGFDNYRHLSLPSDPMLHQMSEADRLLMHRIGVKELKKQLRSNIHIIDTGVKNRLKYLDKLKTQDDKLPDDQPIYAPDNCPILKKGEHFFKFWKDFYERTGDNMRKTEEIFFNAKVTYLNVRLGVHEGKKTYDDGVIWVSDEDWLDRDDKKVQRLVENKEALNDSPDEL